MRSSPSLAALSWPRVFNRQHLAVTRAQSGIVSWKPARTSDPDDYPPPGKTVYTWEKLPPPPRPRKAFTSFVVSLIPLVGFGVPGLIIASQLMGNRNKENVARSLGLFDGLEDEQPVKVDEGPPVAPA